MLLETFTAWFLYVLSDATDIKNQLAVFSFVGKGVITRSLLCRTAGEPPKFTQFIIPHNQDK